MALAWVKVVRNDSSGNGESVFLNGNYTDAAGSIGEPFRTETGMNTFETVDPSLNPTWQITIVIDRQSRNASKNPILVTLEPVASPSDALSTETFQSKPAPEGLKKSSLTAPTPSVLDEPIEVSGQTEKSQLDGPNRGEVPEGAKASKFDNQIYTAVSIALRSLQITQPSEDALAILYQAALLTPDDALAPISTTRLFAGAVLFGRAHSKLTDSYPVALVRIIDGNTVYANAWERLGRLFGHESEEAAIKRLRAGWFSRNATSLLEAATGEGTDGVLTGDAIVRAILSGNRGLLYGPERFPEMSRLRADIEATLRLGASPPKPVVPEVDPTLRPQIDTALSALRITATEQTKELLIHATTYQQGSEPLRFFYIILALLRRSQTSNGIRHPSDPTAILSTAIASADVSGDYYKTLQNYPGPSATQPRDPAVPWQVTPIISRFLQRSFALQQSVFLNSDLGSKGLIAGLLTLQPDELSGEPELTSLDFSVMREKFRDAVQVLMPEALSQWNEAIGFEQYRESVAQLNNDQPWSGEASDDLGVANDAVAMAKVAATKSTSLPLAFGIFGDWGAGKTFFMRLIFEWIARLVTTPEANDGYEHAIVQIQFNAWHYAETNLWASLVGHIFDELDRWMTRKESGEIKTAADAILKRLTTSRQLTLEAAAELVRRRKELAIAGIAHSKAQSELADAEAEASRAPDLVWRVVVDAARREIAKDSDLGQLVTLREDLGVSSVLDGQAKLESALGELRQAASAGNASFVALRATLGSGRTMALAIGALLGVPLMIFGIGTMLVDARGWEWLNHLGGGLGTLAGMLTTMTILVHSFGTRLRSIAEKLEMLRQRINQRIADATISQREKLVKVNATLAQKRTEVEKTRTVVQATSDQVVAAMHEYVEETGALRLRRFVRARAGDEGYARHLGLISTIRKDFEQLESLMLNKEEPAHLKEAREHYEARVEALIRAAKEELPEGQVALMPDEIAKLRETTQNIRDLPGIAAVRFGRIMLYIDDLDRCPPRIVIDVLQAVNMLLSFRLFVVVVAVDARWLSRSLEKTYPDFFREDQNEGSFDEVGRASAADYLEKIFQVPYWVPRMNETASANLVAHLTATDRTSTPSTVRGSTFEPNRPADSASIVAHTSAPLEDNQPQAFWRPSRALELSSEEIGALSLLSPFLGGSPRRTRRFINVYRVAKASLTPQDLTKLEEGAFRALATQLAIATGAPSAFNSWIGACTDGTSRALEERLDELFIEGDERRNLYGAIGAFKQMGGQGQTVLSELIAQIPHATRFSFVVPRQK